jgi:S-adenosylmethionine:tRNA ribosyltransferase-isomerase
MDKIKDYYIDIPEHLIAQYPAEQREYSKLLYLNKTTSEIKDYVFKDAYDLITSNDVLILNDTKVFKARYNFFYNNKKCEILLSKKISNNIWECIISPGKIFKINFEHITKDNIHFKVIAKTSYGRIIQFYNENDILIIFSEVAKVPLPPYITNEEVDLKRYQTVYSKEPASIAAPTAGLHFTKKLLDSLEKKGVKIYYITLHIGLGTFKPIKTERIADFKIHSEFLQISEETVEGLNTAMGKGKKIIAVGTTTVRALETAAINDKKLNKYEGETKLFIKPGYKFKIIDKMITNFHLPDSSLILLVSAFADFKNIKKSYQHAVNNKYRFFSFGDAMFIDD